MINNAQVNRKSLKAPNCKHYWTKTQLKRSKNYLAALNITPMTVFKRLHAMGKFQKEGKWVPHELTENAIANRLNIPIS